MKKRRMLLIFSLCPLLTWADVAMPPEFSAYPVSVYQGPTAQLKLNQPNAKTFRSHFRHALSQPVNSAGEYVSSMWGCGSSCAVYAFVNKRTGQVVAQTFGPEQNEHLFMTRPDSQLIITKSEIWQDSLTPRQYKQSYYVLQQDQLRKVAEFPITEAQFYAE